MPHPMQTTISPKKPESSDSTVAPTRLCVACRSTAPSTALMRLRVNDAGLLVPDPRAALPGRSAWICFCRSCVARLIKKPQILRHRLKRTVPNIDALREAINDHVQAQVVAAILRCRRSGLIVSGAHAVKKNRISSNIVVVAIAQDASIRHKQRNYPACSVFNINLSTVNIGKLINRGPRAVLGFLPGSPTTHLLQWLQRQSALR